MPIPSCSYKFEPLELVPGTDDDDNSVDEGGSSSPGVEEGSESEEELVDDPAIPVPLEDLIHVQVLARDLYTYMLTLINLPLLGYPGRHLAI